ncbi:hypothetical protein CapIbe_005688 [Capra ibex]
MLLSCEGNNGILLLLENVLNTQGSLSTRSRADCQQERKAEQRNEDHVKGKHCFQGSAYKVHMKEDPA